MQGETNKTPTIDVIIPLWNDREYILKAIKSVEGQTLKPAKIIVADDASTDDGPELVKNYKCSVPLEIYTLEENGGPNAARNLGLQHATSEYVAFIDSDDLWYPTKLEEQIKAFQNTSLPRLGLIYCNYDLIDFEGNLITDAPKFELDPKIRGNVFDQLISGNKIAGSASAVMIKRSCFETVGEFDESLRMGEDWDMWLRLAEKFTFDYVQKSLVMVRRHGGSFQNRNKETVFEKELSFYNKWIERLKSDQDVTSKWRYYVASRMINDLPDTTLLKVGKAYMGESLRKYLTAPAFGSFKLALLRIMISGYIRKTLRETWIIIRNTIKVIFG